MKLINHLIFIIPFILFHISTQFNLDGELTIQLSDTRINQKANYLFKVTLVSNDPLTVGSYIQINFPDSYQSKPQTIYPCEVIEWPFLGASLSCTITNRILKVTGGFPQQYLIVEDTNFEFRINDIKNPSVATSSNFFDGLIKNSDDSKIVGIRQAAISITPGSLLVQLSVSPNTVNTQCDLLIKVTPTNPITLNGYLKFETFSIYWTRANTINPELIFKSDINPSCHPVSANLPSNLYCTYSATSTTRTIQIFNIVQGSLTELNEQFILKISTINSPPTTENQGSFWLTTLTSAGEQIDKSGHNKVGNLQAKPILSPSLSLVSYQNNMKTVADIFITIRSIITATDSIVIKIPKQISLDELTRITVQTVQIADFQVTFDDSYRYLEFQGAVITNPVEITIILDSISNPAYVLTTKSFSLWTKRNNYKIDQVIDAFSYTTLAGNIDVSLTPNNYQAGKNANYILDISVTTKLSSGNKLVVVLPAQHFNIPAGSVIKCTSNLSPSCLLTVDINNNLKIENFIQSGEHTAISLTIQSLKNPSVIGVFDSLIVSSYTAEDYLIDKKESGIHFNVGARQIDLNRISIVSDSDVVNSLAQLTITVTPHNNIPQSSRIYVTFPIELQISGISCLPYTCILYSGTTYTITLPQSSADDPIALIIRNIRNPISTAPTTSFQIRVQNAIGTQLEYRTDSLIYAAVKPAQLSIGLTRNSVKNSVNNIDYQLTLVIAFEYTQEVSILITLPKQIQCSGCPVHSSTATHYSMFKDKLNFNADKTILVTFTDIVNFYSLQPQQVEVTILSSDAVFNIASNKFDVTNQQSGLMTFTSGFTPRQLSEGTTLTISDIVVTKNTFKTFIITFGPEFDIAAATLASGSSSYSKTIDPDSKTITLEKLVTAVNSFSISGIIGPAFTPSTNINFKTQSASGYLIDQATPIQWTSLCQLPCKTCQIGELSKCLSCYTNAALVQNKVLYLDNENKCKSTCPDKFFTPDGVNCQQCSTSCSNCYTEATKCSSCPQPSLPYILDTTCYQQCPVGYYEIDTTSPKRCLLCDSQNKFCKTCSNFETCDSCLDNYYFYLQKCYVSCPPDITVANSFTWNCDLCTSNCQKCNSDGCTKCNPGYLLDDGKCFEECQTFGFVPHNGICRGCDTICKTCLNSIYNCLTCDPESTKKFFFQNTCLENCPDGYYKDESLNLCLKCTGPCQYCTTSSVSSCITCIDQYSLFGTTCKSICPDQYYPHASECKACTNNCLTCRSQSICMSCVDGYSLLAQKCIQQCEAGYTEVSKKCIACSNNCKTCDLVNYCSSCFQGTYLYEGSCVFPCPEKYYEFQDKDNNILDCRECPFECATCEDPTKCQSCVGGYELSENSKCVSTCDKGFVPIDSICETCNPECLTCVYAQNNCSQCVAEYYSYLNTENNIRQCFQNCPQSLFSYDKNRTCLIKCPTATYSNIETKLCKDCPELCEECTSVSVCQTCKKGTSMYRGLCYQVCPPSAPESVNFTCVTCDIVQCYQCQKQICKQCNAGFLLTSAGTLCIDSCGANQQYNTVTKECQNTNPDTNNTSGNSTTEPTETSNIDLDFVPVPYIIVGAVLTVIIILLYFTHKISIFGLLYSLIWVILFGSAVTNLIMVMNFQSQIFNSSSQSRLLQEILVNSIERKRTAVVLLIIGITLGVILNITSMIIYFCSVRIKRYVVVALLSGVLGLKLLGGLLCSGLCGVNLRTNKKSFNSSSKYLESGFSVMEIKEEYTKFWKIYDRLQMALLIVDGMLIGAGIMLAFEYTMSNYQFYGGIELVVLGLIDIILTIFWFIGKNRFSLPQTPPPSQSNQESMEHISEKIPNISIDEDSLNEQLTEKMPKTQQIPKNNQNMATYHREFKSEYDKPLDVIKLRNQQIEQALNQGVYRKNKNELAEEQRVEDEESALQSAQKFNRKLKEEEDDYQQESLHIESFQAKVQEQEKRINKNAKPPQQVQNKKQQKDDEENLDELSVNGRQKTEIEEFTNNKVIFEDFDESLQTYVGGEALTFRQNDEQKEEEAIQDVIRENSLGSLQNKKYQPEKQIEIVKVQKQKQTLEIYDIEEESVESKNNIKSPEKYTNIFQYQMQSQEKQKAHSPVQNINQSRNFKNEIIYADLDSVGSAEEYDLDGDNMNQTNRKFFSIEFDRADNQGDDRPGKHISTNFRYTNTMGTNQQEKSQSLMPKKLPIKKKKKRNI